MKGASPIARKQQSEAVLQACLDHHLTDAAGALRAVLLRQVCESELLDDHFDQPLVALATYLRRVLDSEYVLQELVRECDVEWGRDIGERPHFEIGRAH